MSGTIQWMMIIERNESGYVADVTISPDNDINTRLKMTDAVDIATQFEKHLGAPKQAWLLGAGVSVGSNIPIMGPLTERVLFVAKTDSFVEDGQESKIINFLQNDIPEGANIEVFLTHLGDFISMADRSRNGKVVIGSQSVDKDTLVQIHGVLLKIIVDSVRWGYKPQVEENGVVIEKEQIGCAGTDLVVINEHRAFVNAIFSSTRAGLEALRSPVEFFTTNYDTLLEDALALNQIIYQDGFTGGGVAFWEKKEHVQQPPGQAIVTKLHGSIDWRRSSEDPGKLFRVRLNDNYLGSSSIVMIHPQATKYQHAQLDPFAELFQRFRHRLKTSADQVLLICGYSFGDKHINAEIESALSNSRNQLTVVAFSMEGESGLPVALDGWRKQKDFGEKVFIASPRGLYQGAADPVFSLPEGEREWWTFAGVTKLLSQGLPDDIAEQVQ